jgi:glycosyltransferase involved in cell wall biosynthesis
VPERKVRVCTSAADAHFAPVPDGPERRAVLNRYGIVPPYLLYVGNVTPRKNIARLFESFAAVHARHPAVSLVIGGKRRWNNAEIDAAFERLDLGSSVRFTGYMDDADLPAVYSAAEVFVFPSRYEGFGLPLLEAMACGAPVVTSTASSLPEVAGDAALLVDPDDTNGLAEAIERLLTDEPLRADLRNRGIRHAAGFTWKRAAHETLIVYQEARDAFERVPARPVSR